MNENERPARTLRPNLNAIKRLLRAAGKGETWLETEPDGIDRRTRRKLFAGERVYESSIRKIADKLGVEWRTLVLEDDPAPSTDGMFRFDPESVKALRVAAGWSEAEMANKADVTVPDVRAAETTGLCPAAKAVSYARALGYDSPLELAPHSAALGSTRNARRFRRPAVLAGVILTSADLTEEMAKVLAAAFGEELVRLIHLDGEVLLQATALRSVYFELAMESEDARRVLAAYHHGLLDHLRVTDLRILPRRRWPWCLIAALLVSLGLLCGLLVLILREQVPSVAPQKGGAPEDIPQENEQGAGNKGRGKEDFPEKPRLTKEQEYDRKAASFVLSLGGTVRVARPGAEASMEITDVARHPEPFRLTHVNLGENKKVTDADLAHLSGCVELEMLHLDGTGVGDEGMKHLAGLKKLRHLTLERTKVTDAGLKVFAGYETLDHLGLFGLNGVTDAGLANFGNCKGLIRLQLGDMANVTDEGVGHFKDCKKLEILSLANARNITSDGLLQFRGCTKLKTVDVSRTKVGKEGVEEFQKALPDCKIEWP